jgi:hypothetical protein
MVPGMGRIWGTPPLKNNKCNQICIFFVIVWLHFFFARAHRAAHTRRRHHANAYIFIMSSVASTDIPLLTFEQAVVAEVHDFLALKRIKVVFPESLLAVSRSQAVAEIPGKPRDKQLQ